MIVVTLRVLIAFAVLVAVYFGLDAYLRWERRRRLEEEHAAGAAPSLTREDYISKGLAEYERSWEKKALYGIFALPVAVGLILIAIASLT